MLVHLKIENYALIRELSMDFTSGFSVITGETGAGKSILLGALGLILGARADLQSLMDAEKKCILEGHFDISGLELDDFFERNDLDMGHPCLLRREITPNGKSRAFINDTPVNLSLLQSLGERLVDIHSQHETLTLNTSHFRLNLLDMLLDKPVLLDAYTYAFQAYQEVLKEYSIRKEEDERWRTDQDYYRFLYDEMERLALREGEQEEMEEEHSVMQHADEIKRGLQQVLLLLDEGEDNIIGRMGLVEQQLFKLRPLAPQLAELTERLHSTYVELKDLDIELQHLSEKVVVDPERQERYAERLDEIYRLQNKHKVKTIVELLALKEEWGQRLETLDNNGDHLSALEKECAALRLDLSNKAQNLHEARQQAARYLEKSVGHILAELGMKHARLLVELLPAADFTPKGMDIPKFMFSANIGSEVRELSKVASGGELSRLMLAIKSVINQKNILPTIIFDEIDSGVSGDIAGKVGRILQNMSHSMQVIAITHLPQMAAHADMHYRVSKSIHKGKTLSEIQRLDAAQHLYSIASMMSNEHVSEAALRAAEVLINDAKD